MAASAAAHDEELSVAGRVHRLVFVDLDLVLCTMVALSRPGNVGSAHARARAHRSLIRV